MARNHNINEDYQHYQHRRYTEKNLTWRVMAIISLLVFLYFLAQTLITTSPEKETNTIIAGMSLLSTIFFYLISKFYNWKKGWSWISK